MTNDNETGARGSPWWRVDQSAKYAQVGRRALYRAVAAGRLKAVRINGRRDLRFRREWLDAWLEGAVVSREGGESSFGE